MYGRTTQAFHKGKQFVLVCPLCGDALGITDMYANNHAQKHIKKGDVKFEDKRKFREELLATKQRI